MRAIIFADIRTDEFEPVSPEYCYPLLDILGKPLISFFAEKLLDDGFSDITVCTENNSVKKLLNLPGITLSADRDKLLKEKRETVVIEGIPYLNGSLKAAVDFHTSNKYGKTIIKSGGKETGVYIISPENEEKDLGYYNFPGILQKIETPKDYLSAIRYAFKEGLADKDRGVFTGKNTLIEAGAAITPPVFIGDRTVTEPDTEIGSFSVISSDCVIKSGAHIHGTFIGRGSYIGNNVVLRDCVVGEGVIIKDNSSANAVIGKRSLPQKPPRFTPDGITGTVTDFSPQAAARLGECFCFLRNREKIIIACDGGNESLMIKSGVISGLSCGGSFVSDIGQVPECVLRSSISHYHAAGGIYISSEKKINIRFFSPDGCDITSSTVDEIKNLYSAPYSFPVFKVSGFENAGGYSRIYFRKISESFRKISGNRFIYFRSGSESICEYIEHICRSMNIKGIKNPKIFPVQGSISAEISADGRDIYLYDEDCSLIQAEDLFMLSLLAISDKKKLKTAVIPENCSKKLSGFASLCSAETIVCKNSRPEFIRTMLKSGNPLQLIMFTDRVYALAKITEYISGANSTLKSTIAMLPHAIRTVKSSHPVSYDPEELIRKLSAKYKNYLKTGGGIKIFFKNGCVLIMPDKTSKSFTIISEGFSEEYSEELCRNCVNEILHL